MSECIFVRHGESQANAAGIIAMPDAPLDEMGFVEAAQTAERLRGERVSMIVSSPLLRAQQTAQTIAATLGLDPAELQIIPELAERDFGSLRGHPKTHESAWYYMVDGQSGVEPRDDLMKRMTRALALLAKVAPTTGTLVAVGHAVSGFYLMQVAAGKTRVEDFAPVAQMDNAAFVRIPLPGRLMV